MSFLSIPLDMISAPNYYAPAANGMWVLTNPNQQTLWFSLTLNDSLGQRPYTPGNGATLNLTFQRADLINLSPINNGTLINTIQTLVKPATAFTANRTLWSVSLNAQDINTALSGTVKFTLTDSGNVTTWLQNWLIKKMQTDPGC